MMNLLSLFAMIYLGPFSIHLMHMENSLNHDAENGAEISERNVYESGLQGMTILKVISGLPQGYHTEDAVSMEFGIAPMNDGKPQFQKMIIVKSDARGKYSILLPPGMYWIGPKEGHSELKPYDPSPVYLQEKIVIVEANAMTHVDVVELGSAS